MTLGGRPDGAAGRKLSKVLLVEILAPLILFYGLRWLGANQYVALLVGGAIPFLGSIRSIVAERRISGVRLFVLGAMAVTIAGSFIVGSPRILLLRSALLMGALGLFLLGTLLSRRPFLYEAARVVFDEDRQAVWAENWAKFPQFRQLLWRISLAWGIACLVDVAVRIVVVFSLPLDSVPAVDDGLLVVTLVLLVLFQRLYGRPFLRRNGLRLQGVRIMPLARV
jgi:hypothetical protein